MPELPLVNDAQPVTPKKRKMRPGGIYTITCEPNKKMYVGSAKDVTNRWAQHQAMLSCGVHTNVHLQRAWSKYGADAFTFTLVEQLGEYARDVYFSAENRWIDVLRTDGTGLFNIARAEGGWGEDTFARKSEIVKKISENTKIALANPIVKQKMREAKLGVRRTEAEKQNISIKLTGVKKTDVTKANMSAAQKARAASDTKMRETMAATGRRNIGRTPSNAIRFMVNGVIHASGAAALRALNITPRQLSRLVQLGEAQHV